MPRFTPIWNAFNAGELSPLLDGRTDQEKYFSGCKRLRNFIPTIQGPAMRRGGTRYIGTAKGRAWFLPFEFSQAQSYVLEFTNLTLRFWVNRGQLLDGGGLPYEVVTPWTEADLITTEGTFALRVVQSGDIMWICHYEGRFPPYKLSRLGVVNWTLTPISFTNGPFEDVNPDNPLAEFTNGTTGVVTISGGAIFTPNDVGTPFYIEQMDGRNTKAWTARSAVAINDIRRWEGNYYQCVTIGVGVTATGDNPPVHTEGRAWDGNLTRVPNDDFDDLGAEWEYLHSGYGIALISAYISPGSVTATVVKRLPDNVVASPTKRWAFSAFSADRGWPTAVTFFRQRLVYAKGLTLYCSVVGDPDDFSSKDGPDVTEETALVLKLTVNRFDLIRWLVSSTSLLIGTARNEVSVQEQTTAKVFAADNVASTPQTEYGSRLLEPLRVGNAVLFVQRTGRKLRELIYDFSSDRFKAEDLTVLSPQVTDVGVVDYDYQQEPDSIVWCVLANGTLGALTYNRERGVVALAPHVLGGGGLVESIAVISKPDGRRDDVWLSVNRGGTRYVEIIEDNRLVETSPADAFYGDCGITYDGASASVITGLGHLEGQLVQVLADGALHPDRTVAGGSITLDKAASKVQIGFDSPAQLQTMRLDGGSQGGSAQTLVKSISELWLRLKDTIGGRVGPSFNHLDPIPGLDSNVTIGTPSPLVSGDKKMQFPAEMGTDTYVCVESSPMLPMTLVALVGRADIND